MRDELSLKQKRFVAEYLKDLNATRAAIRAGYSEKTAQVQSSKWLSKAMIAEAVAEGQRRQLDAADLSAVSVLEQLRRLSFSDIRTLFDQRGNLRPIRGLSQEEAACIGGFEVIIKNAQAGDGVTDTIHKVKVIDKVRPLEALAKHFGLLVEKIDHQGNIVIKHEI